MHLSEQINIKIEKKCLDRISIKVYHVLGVYHGKIDSSGIDLKLNKRYG